MTYSVSITTTTVIIDQRIENIRINIDGNNVEIPVPVDLKAYFDSQFHRENPSALQRKKYATLINLMRCAYLAGKRSK